MIAFIIVGIILTMDFGAFVFMWRKWLVNPK